MTRLIRTLVIIAGSVFVISGFFFVRHIRKTEKPICFRCNIVVIMIDNLRADALPCYGYRYNTAPHLCRFAEKNIRFTQAFSNSSWTLPSIMSFFTSLYPTNHGMGTTLKDSLNPDIITLPRLLKQNGYRTMFISSNQPSVGLKQGLEQDFAYTRITTSDLKSAAPSWIEAIDTIKAANAHRQPAFVFFHTDNLHDYSDRLSQSSTIFPLDTGYRVLPIPVLKFSEQTRFHAENILLTYASLGGGSKSKAQYRLWYSDMISAQTLAQAEQVYKQLPVQEQRYSESKVIVPILATKNFTEFDVLLRHIYDEAIRETDLYLEQVFRHLENENLLRNTIVIVSSEHGEMLGEHELLGHGVKMYNPEIHIPLIVHVPRTTIKTIDDLVQHIDFYPTIIDLLGIKPTMNLGGISLKWRISNETAGLTNAYVISEWTNRWQAKVIQSKQWKLFTDIPWKANPQCSFMISSVILKKQKTFYLSILLSQQP